MDHYYNTVGIATALIIYNVKYRPNQHYEMYDIKNCYSSKVYVSIVVFNIMWLNPNYFSTKLGEKLYLLFYEDRCIKIYNIATIINCTMTYLCTDVAVLCLISSISNLLLDQQHEDEQ